ncbi:hypothetical protein CRUP_016149 [Coryphaenoides rupestris]|nr:hypothetical protein CRUP_016149 [Coryphaenoides rupestris]
MTHEGFGVGRLAAAVASCVRLPAERVLHLLETHVGHGDGRGPLLLEARFAIEGQQEVLADEQRSPQARHAAQPAHHAEAVRTLLPRKQLLDRHGDALTPPLSVQTDHFLPQRHAGRDSASFMAASDGDSNTSSAYVDISSPCIRTSYQQTDMSNTPQYPIDLRLQPPVAQAAVAKALPLPPLGSVAIFTDPDQSAVPLMPDTHTGRQSQDLHMGLGPTPGSGANTWVQGQGQHLGQGPGPTPRSGPTPGQGQHLGLGPSQGPTPGSGANTWVQGQGQHLGQGPGPTPRSGTNTWVRGQHLGLGPSQGPTPRSRANTWVWGQHLGQGPTPGSGANTWVRGQHLGQGPTPGSRRVHFERINTVPIKGQRAARHASRKGTADWFGVSKDGDATQRWQRKSLRHCSLRYGRLKPQVLREMELPSQDNLSLTSTETPPPLYVPAGQHGMQKVRDQHLGQGQHLGLGAKSGANTWVWGQTPGSRARVNNLGQGPGPTPRSGTNTWVRGQHLGLGPSQGQHLGQGPTPGSGANTWVRGQHLGQGPTPGSGANTWVSRLPGRGQ